MYRRYALLTAALIPGLAIWAQHKNKIPPPPPGLFRPNITFEKYRKPSLKLSATLPLTGSEALPTEARRAVKGGKFLPDGWQATDKKDQFLIELKEGYGPTQSGAIELDMTHLDLAAQATGPKHHFFTFHGDGGGDAFQARQCPFFTLRAGAEYKNKEGNPGIDILWRAGSGRGELAPYGNRKWDPQATYTWRAEWNDKHICLYLNGGKIFGPAEFHERYPAPLKYVFLSTDGIDMNYWYGMIGPVYKTVRIYR